MSHTTNPSQRPAADPVPLPRRGGASAVLHRRTQAPLLQMHAHWSLPAHRSYLHAANFHWQR